MILFTDLLVRQVCVLPLALLLRDKYQKLDQQKLLRIKLLSKKNILIKKGKNYNIGKCWDSSLV